MAFNWPKEPKKSAMYTTLRNVNLYSTVHHSTVQFSTVQYNTVQYSKVNLYILLTRTSLVNPIPPQYWVKQTLLNWLTIIHGKRPWRRRAGGQFCGVRRRPKLFGRFYTVLSVAAPICGRFYTVLPVAASKIGFLTDHRITGSPDHHVC